MKREWLESFVLAFFFIQISSFCFYSRGYLCDFTWPLCILFVLSLAVEWTRLGNALNLMAPRSNATPGIPLGAITLPLLFASQISHASDSRDLSVFQLWAAMGCGNGLIGSTIAIWLWKNRSRTILEISKKDLFLEENEISHSSKPQTMESPIHKALSNGSPLSPLPEDTRTKQRTVHGITFTSYWLTGWLLGSLIVLVMFVNSESMASTHQNGHVSVAAWLAIHMAACGCLNLHLLRTFPNCATPGESLLVSQGLTFYCLDALLKTLSMISPSLPVWTPGSPALAGTGDEIDAVVQAMVVGVCLLPPLSSLLSAASVSLLPEDWNQFPSSMADSLCFYLSLSLVGGLIAPLWLRQIVGLNTHPLFWAVNHVFEHPVSRVALCCYWLLVLILPLGALRRMASQRQLPHILIRKMYHLMAVCMFVPAMILQVGFLRLAFGVALAGLLIVEIIRVRKVLPFGTSIDSFMKAFIDSRDSGPLILSHFSLLLGCALPLWLSDPNKELSLSSFAGILSLGIGDTMASVVGFQYGRIRISSDSKKTVEGTLAGILSMAAGCALLAPFLPAAPDNIGQWSSVVAATVVAGLLEATTSQLDNAFVPLVYYALLCL